MRPIIDKLTSQFLNLLKNIKKIRSLAFYRANWKPEFRPFKT
jgi:hypothetical protein